MDITSFITSQREKALSVGDYGSYRKQLSRRLLVVRKKLNRSTPKGRKYAAKSPVSAEDIASNHEFVHLLLLTSERAWAQAMHMKATQSADGAKSIVGSTKSHIDSRLHKAIVFAGHLVQILNDRAVSGASIEAVLEARAYYTSLAGASKFEKQRWEECLHGYSEARLIYNTIAPSDASKQENLFRDILSSTIDPSIRYAAYQLKLPRTISIETIVSRFIPREDNEFVQELLTRNPDALEDPIARSRKTITKDTEDIPKTIQWRSRTVKIEDAATTQALAVVAVAEEKLSSYLSSNPDAAPQAKATAYDEVLIPSQDAVDATKTAIEELSAEGVPQGDGRMQALQITKTAVSYALVGWRIGRNRVLCGEQDGATLDSDTPRQPKKARKDGKVRPIQPENTGRKLKRLRERVVLYDQTLQSLDSIKELPGVPADQKFLETLQSNRCYFAALRCLAIARSYTLLQDTKKALALLSRASELSLNVSAQENSSPNKPPNLTVTTDQATTLQQTIKALVHQHRALVELHNIDFANQARTENTVIPPLIERLDEYPHRLVDLTNLVTYPPKVQPIPMKPIFLDVAYNYIDYPGRTKGSMEKAVNGVADGVGVKEEKKEPKRGWFGFGR